jgi:pyruvate formate lyase activating enzyme
MTTSNEITGAVHSIETMGTLDGPGLRTVVFLQGCPLKCKFCHNIDCSIPDAGKEYTAQQLVDELLKNRAYWEQYDPAHQETTPDGLPIRGGVTFSGGEPTFQHSFLVNVLQLLTKEGVHTAIDSCSVTTPEVIRSLVPYIDLFMLSIKHMDDQKHQWLTGSTNRQTLHNIQMLDAELSDYNKQHQTRKQIRIRFLVIPGITDDPQHLLDLGAFVQQLNNLENLEILGYGTHGRHKWIELFGKYDLDGVREATKDDLETAAQTLAPLQLPLKW